MSFFKKNKQEYNQSKSDYSDQNELRVIWDSYSKQWPDNNERYQWWKPDSLLPAPKWAIKRAIKVAYLEWPEPIDYLIYSAFFLEFVDLALHLPQEKYDAIDNFRKQRIMCCGEEDKHDPLLMYRPIATAVYTINMLEQQIIKVRDGLKRSKAWNPIDVSDDELLNVRKILLESTVELASLTQEWQFYILSIGRDEYIESQGNL